MFTLRKRNDMIHKNLETHNKSRHKGEKLKYKSFHSRDLSSLVSKKGEECGAHSRGADEIPNLYGLDEWALVDTGLKCSVCSQTITYYHMVEGREFEKENLLGSFKNTKISLIRHLNSEKHQK